MTPPLDILASLVLEDGGTWGDAAVEVPVPCKRQVEYLEPERWSVEVSRKGLAELEAGERDAFGDPVGIDPVRAAEDELISAYAAVHSIDYSEAFRRLIAANMIGQVH